MNASGLYHYQWEKECQSLHRLRSTFRNYYERQVSYMMNITHPKELQIRGFVYFLWHIFRITRATRTNTMRAVVMKKVMTASVMPTVTNFPISSTPVGSSLAAQLVKQIQTLLMIKLKKTAYYTHLNTLCPLFWTELRDGPALIRTHRSGRMELFAFSTGRQVVMTEDFSSSFPTIRQCFQQRWNRKVEMCQKI